MQKGERIECGSFEKMLSKRWELEKKGYEAIQVDPDVLQITKTPTEDE